MKKPAKINTAKLLNITQFANLKDVSRQTIYNRISSKEIVPVYIGEKPYVDPDDYRDMTFPEKERRNLSKKTREGKTTS